mgnify:FL=1
MTWAKEQGQSIAKKALFVITATSLAVNLTTATPLQTNVQSADRSQTRTTSQQVERSSSPTMRQAPEDTTRTHPVQQTTSAEQAASQRHQRDTEMLSDSHERDMDELRRQGKRDGEVYQAEKARRTSLDIDPKQNASQTRDHYAPSRKR